MDPIAQTAVQTLGPVGALLGIIIWYNKSVIPTMMKAHRDDLMGCVKDANDRMERELAKRDTALEKATDKLAAGLDKLAARVEELSVMKGDG
jgi:hypothetical protein